MILENFRRESLKDKLRAQEEARLKELERLELEAEKEEKKEEKKSKNKRSK